MNNSHTQLQHNLITDRRLALVEGVVYYTQSLIGDYKYSSSSNEFNGWLLCDGRSLDADTYPGLYSVIQKKFGAGTGANTFNIPDFRGRVAGTIGQGAGLTLRGMGSNVGAETHTLTIQEMPSHNHGGNTGSTNAGNGGGGLAAADGGNGVDRPGSHSHTIPSEGGGLSHNNMQPTLFGGNYFIFAGIQYNEAVVSSQ